MPPKPEDKTHTVTFDGAQKSETVKDGASIGEKFDQMVTWAEQKAKEIGKTFQAWVDGTKKVYTKFTKILRDVTLTPLFYDGNVAKSTDGSYVIAAKDITVQQAILHILAAQDLIEQADVQAYGPDGEIKDIAVKGLAELQKQPAGEYPNAITFSITGGNAPVDVPVKVTIAAKQDVNAPEIIVKTATTLTIQGSKTTNYQIRANTAQANAQTIETDENGIVTVYNLQRDTTYTISHETAGSVSVTTSLIDSKTICGQGRSDKTATDRNRKRPEGKQQKGSSDLRPSKRNIPGDPARRYQPHRCDSGYLGNSHPRPEWKNHQRCRCKPDTGGASSTILHTGYNRKAFRHDPNRHKR